ncbi:MAG TPA: TetR/AcrR family transcriptional regulator [Caulobacteraceae bacterium]|jgi:TetR/AcrR family transcriptional repressor of nem operon|nr:TetR/AcrR family transcriptional regulator [Caulobacteraceae bacterium]
MGHSQAGKAVSRERILSLASAQIRKDGLQSLSVGKLMGKAGLTHGGFYGHFKSREALLAKALERALSDGASAARAAGQNRPASFSGFVRRYLSRAHRDAPDTGCAIAALAGDVGRADPASRVVMESSIESLIASVADQLGGDDEREAITAVAAMVGALPLSRVVTDPKRSDAILRAVREELMALAPREAD